MPHSLVGFGEVILVFLDEVVLFGQCCHRADVFNSFRYKLGKENKFYEARSVFIYCLKGHNMQQSGQKGQHFSKSIND